MWQSPPLLICSRRFVVAGWRQNAFSRELLRNHLISAYAQFLHSSMLEQCRITASAVRFVVICGNSIFGILSMPIPVI